MAINGDDFEHLGLPTEADERFNPNAAVMRAESLSRKRCSGRSGTRQALTGSHRRLRHPRSDFAVWAYIQSSRVELCWWSSSVRNPRQSASKRPTPGFIEPELAMAVDKVPFGDRWLHEIKFDGYRVQVHLRDAAVKVFARGMVLRDRQTGWQGIVAVEIEQVEGDQRDRRGSLQLVLPRSQ